MQEFETKKVKEIWDEGGLPFVNSLPPYVYVLIVLVIIFILYQFIGGAITFVALGKNFEENLPLTRIILAFGQFFLILAPTIFFARFQTKHIVSLFRINIPDPVILFLSVLGITFINPVIQGYMALQTYFIESLPFYNNVIEPVKKLFDEIDKTTLKIVGAHSVIEFVIVVFVIAITPAICEELLFRGFVLKNLERNSKVKIAIFLTGFLFAVYHFQPFNIVPLILLGVYLSFIVHYSNSVITGIISHFLNNFYAAYVMYRYGKDVNLPDVGDNTLNQILVILIFLILFILTCYLMFKLGKRKLKQRLSFEKDRISDEK